MIIRSMTISDAESVANIHIDSWRVAYRGIVPQDYLDSLDIDKRIAFWEKNISNCGSMIQLVAEIEKKVVGFITGLENRSKVELPHIDSELWAIYVDPNQMRNGVGKELVKAFTEKLKNLNKKKMCIWVLADNHRAINFYKKCGAYHTEVKKMIDLGGKNLEEIALEIKL